MTVQTSSANDTLQVFVARSNQIVGIVNNLTDGVLYVNGSIIFSNAFAFTVQSLNVAQTIVMTAQSGNSVYLLSSNAVINGSGYITGSGIGLYVSNNAVVGGNLSVHGVDVFSEITNSYNDANAAFVQANAVNVLATSGYVQTNAAFIQANAANTLATKGYGQANAANNMAFSGYFAANIAQLTANVAQGYGLTANTLAASAYAQANSATNSASAAYGQANTDATNITATNTLAGASYAHANNAYNAGVSAYIEANSAFTLADASIINGTYVDVTNSRTFSTIYTNNIQKPLFVSIMGSVPFSTIDDWNIFVNGVAVATSSASSINTPFNQALTIGITFIVPSGGTYELTNISNSTITKWFEYS